MLSLYLNKNFENTIKNILKHYGNGVFLVNGNSSRS